MRQDAAKIQVFETNIFCNMLGIQSDSDFLKPYCRYPEQV